MEKDYYNILGVNKDASQEEIKRAYRKIAVENHPDKKPGDPVAEEKFKEAAEAYSVLGDPDKRKEYDSPPIDLGLDFGDIFSAFFGQGSRTAAGRDLGINLSISLKDALTGIKKELRYSRTVICPECSGEGGEGKEACVFCKGMGSIFKGFRCPRCSGRGYTFKKICKKCNGQGVIKTTETVNLEIKPGEYYPGITYLFKGFGDTVSDGIFGDLRVAVFPTNTPNFEIHGRDIMGTCELPLKIALLGGEIDIKTPKDEIIRGKINPGTQTGTILSFPGEGFKGGKLYIRLNIVLPELTDEQKAELSKIL